MQPQQEVRPDDLFVTSSALNWAETNTTAAMITACGNAFTLQCPLVGGDQYTRIEPDLRQYILALQCPAMGRGQGNSRLLPHGAGSALSLAVPSKGASQDNFTALAFASLCVAIVQCPLVAWVV